jgi:hypothetical protein
MNVGGDLKEMSTIAPGSSGLADQPQVGFVDQVGGLEAETRALPADMTGCDLSQFAVGDFHQARFGVRLAIPEAAEKTGYIAIWLVRH